jgi:hypothetical protein
VAEGEAVVKARRTMARSKAISIKTTSTTFTVIPIEAIFGDYPLAKWAKEFS